MHGAGHRHPVAALHEGIMACHRSSQSKCHIPRPRVFPNQLATMRRARRRRSRPRVTRCDNSDRTHRGQLIDPATLSSQGWQ